MTASGPKINDSPTERRPYGPNVNSTDPWPLVESLFHQGCRVMQNDGAGQLISDPQERHRALILRSLEELAPFSCRSALLFPPRPIRFCGCHNSWLTFVLVHVHIAVNLPHLGDSLGFGQSVLHLPSSCNRLKP